MDMKKKQLIYNSLTKTLFLLFKSINKFEYIINARR